MVNFLDEFLSLYRTDINTVFSRNLFIIFTLFSYCWGKNLTYAKLDLRTRTYLIVRMVTTIMRKFYKFRTQSTYVNVFNNVRKLLRISKNTIERNFDSKFEVTYSTAN